MVTPVELTAALLHIAKRRGYKAFYELSDENNNAKIKSQRRRRKRYLQGINEYCRCYKNGGYRSIAEAIMKDSEHFSDKISGRYKYRNIKEKMKRERKIRWQNK